MGLGLKPKLNLYVCMFRFFVLIRIGRLLWIY